MPKTEVAAKQALFDAHGLDPKKLFKDRPVQAGYDGHYFDFSDKLAEKAELKRCLDADAGMAKREQELWDTVESWWKKAQRQIAELPQTKAPMPVRASLLMSFEKAVRLVGLLDHFLVTGVIATWWDDAQNDLKGLGAQGFAGLVEAWLTSIRASLEDDEVKENPVDHPMTKRLMPQYLADMAECETTKAGLDATIKAAQPSEEEAEDSDEKLSDDELKTLKKDLGAAKKKLKALKADFVETNLGSIATWSSGGTPAKSRGDYWVGDIPWVSPKDMKRFTLNDTEDHISERAVSNGARIVPAGTIFIVVRGMILAHTFPVCIAGRSMSFNQDVKALVPQSGVEGRFLAHWLHGNRAKLLSLVTEATHGTKRLDLHDLQATEVLLPAPSEQRRITEILDTLDEAIRKTEQIIAKLKQVKQGLLHDLLTRGIDDNGELRDPARTPNSLMTRHWGFFPEHGAMVSWPILSRARLGMGCINQRVFTPMKEHPSSVLTASTTESSRISPA